RRAHDLEEERARVGELGLRLALERLAQQVDRHLRRDFAVRMAAQAIGHREQGAIGRLPEADAVLLVAPVADARVLGEAEFHLPAILPGLSPSSAFCSAKTL